MFKKNATTLKKQMWWKQLRVSTPPPSLPPSLPPFSSFRFCNFRHINKHHFLLTMILFLFRPECDSSSLLPPSLPPSQMKLVLGTAILAILLVIIIPIAVTGKRFYNANKRNKN